MTVTAIEVGSGDPITVVAVPVTQTVEVLPPAPTQVVEVLTPGLPGPQNLFVQPTDPGMTSPGLWIQTGIDGDGTTMWIEDGT